MASGRRIFSPEKARPSVFWLLGGILVPAISVLAKVEIEGGEKLPAEGAFVLAPNHYTNLDPVVVAVLVWRLGRAPRFMAKESLFRVPVLGAAMRATGMVPVSRTSSAAAARDTIRGSEEIVKHGRGVVVYPEGTLTRDPDLWPMRGKTGAVRLAVAGGIPIVPMAQWGVQEIMPRYGKLRLWPLRRRVRVVIGDPLDPVALGADLAKPGTLVRATDALMGRIAELLGTLRGQTPPAERWNPSAHGQSETGRLES